MTGLTRAQVREIDRRATEEYGVPSIVLMENAGRGAAEVLMWLNPERKQVQVLCGKGNNGGDGFVIARHLDNAGWPVIVLLFADPNELTGDAAANHRTIAGSLRSVIVVPPSKMEQVAATLTETLPNVDDWFVDAVFGTGLTGPIRPPLDGVVAALCSSPVNVLAVDIPSGLDCDTGEPLGACVRATHTVTFVAPKAGFANPAAARWLGTVHVAGIGAPRKLLEEYGVTP
ncbi:MAG: NAD(P)H-hydrate epimerase [Gemmataceae bacterium]